MGQSNELYQHEVRVTWNWTAEKKAKVIGSLGFLSPHILFFLLHFSKMCHPLHPLQDEKNIEIIAIQSSSTRNDRYL